MSPSAGIEIFHRYPVYTYVTCSIACNIGHNPVRYKIFYIASKVTFSVIQHLSQNKSSPL